MSFDVAIFDMQTTGITTRADEDDSFLDDPKVTDYSVGFCLNGDPEALAAPDGNLIQV